MKRRIAGLAVMGLVLAGIAWAQTPENSSPAATNVTNAEYPRILPDHRVVFAAKAPEARKVQIDLGKLYDMTRDTQGVWRVTTEPQSQGFHYYSLVIDGVRLADPASQTFYGMGRMASGIEIPYAGIDYYTCKPVPHGDVRMKQYFSAVTRSMRRLFVYTPPGYNQDLNTRYPVVYILHGGGEDERGWVAQGNANFILDNLLAEKKAKPMLLVMVDGNMGLPGFGEDYLRGFEAELKQSVIPFIEKEFRAIPEANSRALAGLSMGGLQTLYAGLRNPQLFSYLGVFSSGWILPMQKAVADAQYEYLQKNAAAINGSLKLFWISMGGKEDIAYDNCQKMMAKLDEMKIKHTYYESPGGHTWPAWRDDLHQWAPLLFQ